MIPPYPLAWPDGMPRTPSARRQRSQFKTTLAGAIDNVSTSLRLFGRDSGSPVTEIVATSNVGGLSLGQAPSVDPGVAVWFKWEGELRCIAVDRYPKPEHNLQAIHHVIEARRTEVRHGGIVIARSAFRGFIALPKPEGSKPWHELLGVGVNASVAEIDAAFKAKARTAHPDAGGDAQVFKALADARNEGRKANA